MTHTALARKYRPTRFGELAAQEHVAAGLMGAVAKNRVAHAYLLTGPRGVGKTSAARILAMALNCERRGADEPDRAPGEPCGACDSCRRIWSGATNLDVVEIDAASNRGVDDARELRERAMYAASGPDHHKIYIIDEAHMLTREAWNALLKILEEPPPRVVFVFATTEPAKIANTAAPVMSRVQRFDFRRLGPQVITGRLRYVVGEEGVEAEDDALLLIARLAAGGMRDALSVLDQVLAFGDGAITASAVRDALGLIGEELYEEVLTFVAERRPEAVFPFVARLVDAGADLTEFVGGTGEVLRALMARILGAPPDALTDALRRTIDRFAERFTEGDVLRMLRLLQDAETAIRRSANPRLQVEMLLLQWALLDRTVELADVLAALQASTAVGNRPAMGGASAPRPPRSSRGRTTMARTSAGSAEDGRVEEQSPSAGRRDEPLPSPVAPGPPTIERLRGSWEAIREALGRRKRLLGEALAHAEPRAVRDDEVVLEVTDSDVHLDGLTRNRDAIAHAISEVLGARVRVTLTGGGGTEGRPTPPARLDQQAERDHRLQGYRAKDQSLDAVAETLDLELLE